MCKAIQCFGSRLFPSSGKEAPNLVCPLDEAVLSLWAQQKQ